MRRCLHRCVELDHDLNEKMLAKTRESRSRLDRWLNQVSENWVYIEVVGSIDTSADTTTETLVDTSLLSNLGFQM